MGTPADVSDRAVTEGWADDRTMYEAETVKSRLWTLLYAIPTILLLTFTIKSIRHKNDLMFYWSLLIGLTLFQIIPIAALLNVLTDGLTFIIPLIFFLIFISGQIFSIIRIVKLSKVKQLKAMCNDCFDKEYKSFPSEKEWLDFDMELCKKLGSNKMMNLEFKHDKKRNKDDGEYLYQCLSCKQIWKLKDPDYSFRGYFLKLK